MITLLMHSKGTSSLERSRLAVTVLQVILVPIKNQRWALLLALYILHVCSVTSVVSDSLQSYGW